MFKIPYFDNTSPYWGKCPKHWRLVVYRYPDYDLYNAYPERCSECHKESRRNWILKRREAGRKERIRQREEYKSRSRSMISAIKELYSEE